jgi:hypothetical protein
VAARVRSTRAVFEDHLRKRRSGDLEADLAANYADEVTLLTGAGVYRGKDGVRRCAEVLWRQLPCPRYRYQLRLVEGEMAFLVWSARCPTAWVEGGADSFLIRGGKILIQTIQYTARPT